MAGQDQREGALPEPIVIDCGPDAQELLTREWVLTNGLGAYASATVAGVNTRRYHGLLVAPVRPPVGRIVALSCLMDQVTLTDEAGTPRTYDLSTFEFERVFEPDGREFLREFRQDTTIQFVYRLGGVELTREIVLAEGANAVAVRYCLNGADGKLRTWPFAALRDHHVLRHAAGASAITFSSTPAGVRVEDRRSGTEALWVDLDGGSFVPDGGWWYRFRYRSDIARGQEGFEDLYTPGWLETDLAGGRPVQLTASLGEPAEVNFEATVQRKRRRLARRTAAVADADETTRRLAVAGDAFVVARGRSDGTAGRSIMAGYPWFADWGRDAMIALPGLLLETGRLEAALDVLKTFAEAMDQGMIPNRFDDRGGSPHYNSIDASLWFVIAADRYVRAGGSESDWASSLAGPVDRILRAYHDGTRFGIHADADGLIAGGDAQTQLTWMDVKFAGQAITPRHGKAVEVNALWYAAVRIAAERSPEAGRADFYVDLAARVEAAFERTFWNDAAGCLYDCVCDGDADASIRPNQIFAVALPYSPLGADRQAAVVEVVQRELLTPRGLRTLAPSDPQYRGRYGTSWESRDRAYHQGTVWPWLMGPFVEAYLKVNGFSDGARAQAGKWLGGFDEHLAEAGVGFISEVFDGDPPHAPGGCIAQAWSVAELLRAKRLLARGPESR